MHQNGSNSFQPATTTVRALVSLAALGVTEAERGGDLVPSTSVGVRAAPLSQETCRVVNFGLGQAEKETCSALPFQTHFCVSSEAEQYFLLNFTVFRIGKTLLQSTSPAHSSVNSPALIQLLRALFEGSL